MPNDSSATTARTTSAALVSRRGLPQGTAGPHRISLEASGAGQSGYQVHDEYCHRQRAVDFINRDRCPRAHRQRSRARAILSHRRVDAAASALRRAGSGLSPLRGTRPAAANPYAAARDPPPAHPLADGARRHPHDESRRRRPCAGRVLGAREPDGRDDRADARRARRQWLRREHPRRLFLRSRRLAGRARLVVEAHVLRGIGQSAADRALAGTDPAGAAFGARRQCPGLDRDPR